MTNQKNRFFTLVFSCCPGAGEMYMGLYKQGIGLMGLFFGAGALVACLGLEELLLFICPIVWCYSFFHTHNLRHMSVEEFAAAEDKFFFEDYVNWKRDWKFTTKHRRIFGVVLLLIAFCELWKQAMYLLGNLFYVPDFIWSINHSVPQIIIAVLILAAALHLMRAPKEDDLAEKAEELPEEAEEAEEITEPEEI